MNAFGIRMISHTGTIASTTITVRGCTPEFVGALIAWVKAGNFQTVPVKGYQKAHAKRASEHGMQDITLHEGMNGVTAVLVNVPEMPVEGVDVKWDEQVMAAPAVPQPTAGWKPGDNLFA